MTELELDDDDDNDEDDDEDSIDRCLPEEASSAPMKQNDEILVTAAAVAVVVAVVRAGDRVGHLRIFPGAHSPGGAHGGP